MGVQSTITIGSTTYDVYGNDANEKAYFAARLGSDNYDAASGTDRKKARITATRWLDRMRWQGDPTTPPVPGGQPLQFPRDDIEDRNGADVSGTTPDDVEHACYELMEVVLEDPAAQDKPNAGSNVKQAEAGPAAVEFFRATAGDGESSRLPQTAHELVGHLLAGASEIHPPVAEGTDNESQFDDCDRYGLSEGWA